MIHCWNVLSPRSVLTSCQGGRRSGMSGRLRDVLVEGEACCFMHAHSTLAAKSSLASPSNETITFLPYSVNLAALLSSHTMQLLLQICNSWSPSDNAATAARTELSAKQVIGGSTPDKNFNSIQLSLQMTGILPDSASCQYWILGFLRYLRVDASSFLRIVLLEIVRNCNHLSEYSTWPISFLLTSIEQVFAVVAEACKEHVTMSLSDGMNDVSRKLLRRI